MRRPTRLPAVAIVLCWLVALPPLVATGQSWELVPLGAIGALLALFWRPIQVWVGRLEHDAPAASSGGTVERLELLEEELRAVRQEQRQLQEVVRWQEQLLQQAPAAVDGAPDLHLGGAERRSTRGRR